MNYGDFLLFELCDTIFTAVMDKEVILYGGVYEYTVAYLIEKLNEAIEAKGEDGTVTIRVNTMGGDPQSAMALLSKCQELSARLRTKIDGRAYSAGAFLSLVTAESEAVETANFVFHRAAYPEYVEKNPEYFTDALKKILDDVNAKLKKIFLARVDVAMFEKITKIKVDDLFSMNGRIDAVLTAREALKCNVISKVVPITIEKRREIAAFMEASASQYGGFEGIRMAAHVEEKPQNKNSMTLAEFKAAHPEVFAQAVQEGVTQERDRVESFMVFAEHDLPGVKKGIEAGKPMTAKEMAEFGLKVTSALQLKAAGKDAPDAGNQPPAESKEDKPKTEKEKALANFEASIDAGLKKMKEGK